MKTAKKETLHENQLVLWFLVWFG